MRLTADDTSPRAREGSRDHADPLILAALAAGNTQAQAAELAGVSASTVARRLREPGFTRKLHDLRRDLIERTTDALTAGTLEASASLCAVLQDLEAPPAARVQASKVLLEGTLKFQEHSLLLGRMRALESALESALGIEPGTFKAERK